MALQPPARPSAANPYAGRYALWSFLGLWVLATTLLFTLTQSPLAPLAFLGPLGLGAGVTALVARSVTFRWPPAAYPLLVGALAAAVNAPVLSLIF
jgi:hypothetical protein